MTGLLKDVLTERADTAPPVTIDPELVIGAGRRRVRRGRLVAGLAAASVVGVVAAGVAVLPDPRSPGASDGSPGPAAGAGVAPFADRRVGWAEGSTIHWGRRAFDAGRPVTSYVQTDDGFVYTTGGGEVWFFDGSSSVRAGSAASGRLRADDTGSLVAWLGADPDGAPQYVVYDTARREVVAEVDEPTIAGPAVEGQETGSWDSGAQVYAVDDGSVYWRGADLTLVRHDVASGEETVLFDGPTGLGEGGAKPAVPYDVVDAAGGSVAFLVDAGDGSAGFGGAKRVTLRVGRAVDDSAVVLPSGTDGALSPDGRTIVVEEDDHSAVYDTRTGTLVPFSPAGYAFVSGYGWENDATLTAVGVQDLGADPLSVDFLRCAVGGTCQVVDSASVPAGRAERLVLPTGDPAT